MKGVSILTTAARFVLRRIKGTQVDTTSPTWRESGRRQGEKEGRRM